MFPRLEKIRTVPAVSGDFNAAGSTVIVTVVDPVNVAGAVEVMRCAPVVSTRYRTGSVAVEVSVRSKVPMPLSTARAVGVTDMSPMCMGVAGVTTSGMFEGRQRPRSEQVCPVLHGTLTLHSCVQSPRSQYSPLGQSGFRVQCGASAGATGVIGSTGFRGFCDEEEQAINPARNATARGIRAVVRSPAP